VGGYRLGSGARLPPLQLDDEEAVAVAVGLQAAVHGSLAGVEETAVRALAKLEQVLPARLRRRVETLRRFTVTVAPQHGASPVDPAVLTTVSAACRDHERLRFDYRTHDGPQTVRIVEPHRLVAWGRRWYLVGWDIERGDWRTFRVDRVAPRIPTGPRFEPRPLPSDDLAAYVSQHVSAAAWRYRARVLVHAPAEEVAARLAGAAAGTVEPRDESTCVFDTGADSIETLGVYLSLLGVDFDVTDPPELAAYVRTLAARYARAAPE
jgi:predicted DNA-binding transcriptional regulator YafY